MTEPPGRDFVLYLRKSKGRAGIARQRRDSERHADRIGGRIVAEFIDADRTAFSRVGEGPAQRDNYTAMLAMLRADTREIPLGVLAWHADRLSRKTAESETFVAVCASGRHPVETARSGSYDLTTPTGRKRFRTDVVDAEYEVDHMIERIEAMKVEAAADGRWLGGRRPFGFEPDGVTIRPVEAAAIVRCADAVLAGQSLASIARELNADGMPTARGSRWDSIGVRRLLLRARVAGISVHRGEEVGPAVWPAILPEERWRAVAAILNDPARTTSPGPDPRWLGTGLYICSIHAEPSMRVAARSSGGKNMYVCRYQRHLARAAEPLDEFVSTLIVGRVSREDAADLLIDHERPDMEGVRDEATAVRGRINEIAELLGDGTMTKAQFQIANAKAAARLAELESQMAHVGTPEALRDLIHADDPLAAWERMHISRRRSVLRALLTVTVMPAPRGRPVKGTAHIPRAVDVAWLR